MGMFDTILCKYPLPLSETLRKLPIDWTETSFQTKNLEESLSLYTITSEGELLKEVIENEYIEYTKEELKKLKPKPWSSFKEIKIKNKYVEAVQHHGTVTFYTSVDYTEEEELWVEFNAYFIYGKLDKIELIEERKVISQALSVTQWEQERLKKAKQPWSRIKYVLNYLGWKWAWYKIARMLYFLGNWCGRAHSFIYRELV